MRRGCEQNITKFLDSNLKRFEQFLQTIRRFIGNPPAPSAKFLSVSNGSHNYTVVNALDLITGITRVPEKGYHQGRHTHLI